MGSEWSEDAIELERQMKQTAYYKSSSYSSILKFK